jgi:streptogramin lyase
MTGRNGPRRTTRRAVVTGAGLTLVALVGPALLLGCTVTRPPGGSATTGTTVTRPPGGSATTRAVGPRVVGAIPLPWAADLVAASGGSVWLTGRDHRRVARVDLASGKILHETDLPSRAYRLLVADGSVWAAGELNITRISIQDGAVLTRLRPGFDPADIAVLGGTLWTANWEQGPTFLYRIDMATNRLLPGATPVRAETLQITAGDGAVWAPSHDESILVRVDASSGRRLAEVPLPSEPHGIGLGAGGVWIANYHTQSVTKVDPRTTRILSPAIPVGLPAGRILVGAGSVWVLPEWDRPGEARSDEIARIDPRTLAVETIHVGGAPMDGAFADGRLFVVTQQPDRLVELTP